MIAKIYQAGRQIGFSHLLSGALLAVAAFFTNSIPPDILIDL
jgi:hypothetical protein